MGSSKHEFKKHDDDNSDDIENELNDDDDDNHDIFRVIEMHPENNETDDSASDFYEEEEMIENTESDGSVSQLSEEKEDTSDEDFELDESSEDGSESDSSSIRSLGAGRENTDEDDLIKKIKEAKKIKRQQPPDIMNDDVVTNISFSPADDVIAVATIEGDVCLYSYDFEKTELLLKYSAHMGSCRKLEYDETGELIYTVSEDKSIIVAESNTGKFKNVFDRAHTSPIFSLTVINKNLFCTGDDEGVVKLWDRRKKDEAFCIKIGKDYVSSLRCIDEGSTLACTAGDGTVTGVNMNTRRIVNKSEPYDAELTCSGLFCSNTKLAVGTSVGSLLLYSWGQFDSWNDEFPGLDKTKHAINCMIPITENIVITGLDNGYIRSTNLFPMRHIGIVGQHSNSVECLDINKDGTLIASCSIENKVCFWNVEYFEDVHVTDKNKKDNDKAKEHNLPSSLGVNASDFFAGLA